MDDQTQNENNQDHNSMWKTLGIVALGILSIGAFVYFVSENGDEGLDDNTSENIDQETQDKLYLAEEFYETVRPELSEDGQEDIDTLWMYIEEDPEVLNLDADQHPVYVVEAYDNIKTEIKIAIAAGEQPTLDVEIGDEFLITGTLVETTDMGPFGPMYMIEDIETGATLYFAFDAATYEDIAAKEMAGKEVELTIEVTGVDGLNASYYVIDGPNLLVEEEATE